MGRADRSRGRQLTLVRNFPGDRCRHFHGHVEQHLGEGLGQRVGLQRGHAAAAQRLGVTQSAVSHGLDKLRAILGDPLFVPMQELWKNRGGWGGVLAAKDGTVIAFQSPGGGNCRRSRDGGKTWDPEILLAPDAREGRALVDETKGDVLYVNPPMGWLYRSRDSGASWTREGVKVRLLLDSLGCLKTRGRFVHRHHVAEKDHEIVER